MKRILTRIIGIALVIAGIAGLIFAIAAVILLARVEPQVTAAVLSQVDMLDRAMTATADGLVLVDDSMVQLQGAVAPLESAVVAVGRTMGETAPMVDALSFLLGEQLPSTIASTQETLSSLAATAGTIDTVLSGLAAVPFLDLGYQPDRPLGEGVQEVADSLAGMPATLRQAGAGLDLAGESLGTVGGDISALAVTVGQIEGTVESARSVLAQYQGVVADLKRLVDTLQAGLPVWLRYLRLGISLILIWLGIAQFTLITQGWELIGRSRKQPEATAE
jgi:hypothetical protein